MKQEATKKIESVQMLRGIIEDKFTKILKEKLKVKKY